MIEKLKKIKHYPIGMCGTALGFLTLANAIEAMGFPYIKPIATIFGIIAIYLMALKVITYPKQIVEELKNTSVGSFYPTIDMTLFLLALNFYSISPKIAVWIVIFGVVLHLFLFLIFFGFRLRKFEMKDILPSWFIVLVGMIVGTVAAAKMGQIELAKVLFYVGVILYIISWFFVVYRVFKKEKIDEAMKPSVLIMAAPAGLSIAGYLSLGKNIVVNPILLWFLILTGIFNLIYAYFFVPKFILKGFKLNYGALTFPFAISTMATVMLSTYFYANGFNLLSSTCKGLAIFQAVICSVLILYVIINYIISGLKVLFSRKIENV